MTREQALESLGRDVFDVLVVGAGIVGARVAYDAARAGLRVALVDAGDIAGATSGASSKLIHGGLRYLAAGRLGLVREARCEQHALRTRVAPHLVRGLPLVLAVDREADAGPRVVAAGLHAYCALSGFRARGGRLIDPYEAERRLPGLHPERAAGFALLEEAQTHDARLTLATVRGAAEAGAAVCTHVAVVALNVVRGRVVGAVAETLDGEPVVIRCRAMVNATGPWVDRLRGLEQPGATPLVRLSKGVHAVLPAPAGWRAGLALSLGRQRAAFAVPWYGVLLVGVTDTPYDGDPAQAAPEPAEVDALLGRIAPYVPGLERRVLSAFAGLRALPPGRGETLTACREHLVSVGPAGMVSVAGGKLTTHRRIALDALRRLPPEVRPRRVPRRDAELPGGRPGPGLLARAGDPTVAHLVTLYGAEAETLLEGDLEPIHPEAPDVWAQVDHAVRHEWAVTPADAARRTTLAVRGLADGLALERIRARTAGALVRG